MGSLFGDEARNRILAKSEGVAEEFEYMLPYGSYACETKIKS